MLNNEIIKKKIVFSNVVKFVISHIRKKIKLLGLYIYIDLF